MIVYVSDGSSQMVAFLGKNSVEMVSDSNTTLCGGLLCDQNGLIPERIQLLNLSHLFPTGFTDSLKAPK